MAEATSAAGREQELAAKLREQLSAANSDAARQVCCAAYSFARELAWSRMFAPYQSPCL